MKWLSNNGKEYELKDMDTGHIQNCVIKLDEKIQACHRLKLGGFRYRGIWGTTWIDMFKQELIRRGVASGMEW